MRRVIECRWFLASLVAFVLLDDIPRVADQPGSLLIAAAYAKGGNGGSDHSDHGAGDPASASAGGAAGSGGGAAGSGSGNGAAAAGSGSGNGAGAAGTEPGNGGGAWDGRKVSVGRGIALGIDAMASQLVAFVRPFVTHPRKRQRTAPVVYRNRERAAPAPSAQATPPTDPRVTDPAAATVPAGPMPAAPPTTADLPAPDDVLLSCPNARDPQLSIRACSAAIESGRLSFDRLAVVYYDRANAFRRIGRNDDAIRDVDQAIRLNPNFAHAFNNRGNLYFDKQQYSRAIDDYDEALRLDPKFVLALDNRGRAYTATGDPESAIEDYNRAVGLGGASADLFNNRGSAYMALGQYRRAVADFNRALRSDPDFVYARRNREIALNALRPDNRATAAALQ
jgi:hypothetical protein